MRRRPATPEDRDRAEHLLRAARLSERGRDRIGEFPWRQIVGMRNIVVHVYWGIDTREVVQAVRVDLPPLIAALEAALERWPQENEPSS